jgi:hypothetical protein
MNTELQNYRTKYLHRFGHIGGRTCECGEGHEAMINCFLNRELHEEERDAPAAENMSVGHADRKAFGRHRTRRNVKTSRQ